MSKRNVCIWFAWNGIKGLTSNCGFSNLETPEENQNYANTNKICPNCGRTIRFVLLDFVVGRDGRMHLRDKEVFEQK